MPEITSENISVSAFWDVLSCFGLDDDVCEYEDGKDVGEYMDAMGLSPVTKAHTTTHAVTSYAWRTKKAGTSRSFSRIWLAATVYRYIL